MTRRLLLRLFGAPRRPVTWRTALPLLLFGLFYGALCAALEFSGKLTFARPAAFAVLLVAPWIWWAQLAGRTGFGRGRALASLLLRLALVGLFAMLLAEPRAVRASRTLALVYVVDVSDSIGGPAGEQALRYVVRTAAEKPERDHAGLVFFGRDAAVELPARQSFPFEAINARVARDATNLARALSVAAAILPAEHAGRIVLVSDGSQTEGSLGPVLDELAARRIPVDTLGIVYGYEREVWLERLDLPRRVKRGETYEAAVILNALSAGGGTLVLTENGREIHRAPVQYRAGKNRLVLPLHLREPGYYEYVATFEAPPGTDGWRENNIAINHLFLRGKGRVLLVTDPEGNPLDTEHLVRGLRAAQREVTQLSAYQVPRDPLSLLPYDCIVFANVPRETFDDVQLAAVRDAVYQQGAGFLMIGGKNSFGPGGWHRTTIEEILPVTMDISTRKVLPKGALAIVLHTCEFPEGNTWGKRITKQAIRVLGAQDEVGVLVYDYNGTDQWLFPLTPAAAYPRLAPKINQAQIGDMPAFGPTMQMGLSALKKSDAAARHMIIISDGDPSPPPPALLQQFRAASISVSTVSIHPHGGQEVKIMQIIAQATGGRYYAAKSAERLPAIFIKEAKTLRRSLIQNKVFTPEILFSSTILKGLPALPPLRGYVLTTPKPRSRTSLEGPDPEETDPVLVTWRHGLGQTAAFTSDLSTNWGRDWVAWSGYRPFVAGLVTDLSRVERPSHLQLELLAQGDQGVLLLSDHHPSPALLEVAARVSGPRNKSVSVRLEQVGLRRYRGTFPLWGKGRYHTVALGRGDGRSEQALAGLAVPYSPEYLRFRADPLLLEQIREKTGGRALSGKETGQQLYGEERQPRKSSRAVFALFLLALACLLPLDVAVRRVQLDRAAILGWLGFGRKESSGTLGRLLERKEQIQFAAPSPELRLPPAAPQPTPPKTKTQPPPPEDDAPLSTTAHLLALKKKWKKDEDQ